MSMLSLCMQAVNFEIPPELVTEYCRTTRYGQGYWQALDTDAILIEEVINKRVLPDLNVEYARSIEVSLSDCIVESVGGSDFIVTVPPKLTGGYKILTVLGVNFGSVYPNYSSESTTGSVGSGILSAAQKLANSNQLINLNYSVRCEMISHNSFRIRRAPAMIPNAVVELMIEHDSNLNSLNMTAAAYFKKLVVLATKAAIYTRLKIRVNQAKLDGGSELGAFGEFLDSYADANELYLEELRKASKIGWLADDHSKYLLYQTVSSNLI